MNRNLLTEITTKINMNNPTVPLMWAHILSSWHIFEVYEDFFLQLGKGYHFDESWYVQDLVSGLLGETFAYKTLPSTPISFQKT